MPDEAPSWYRGDLHLARPRGEQKPIWFPTLPPPPKPSPDQPGGETPPTTRRAHAALSAELHCARVARLTRADLEPIAAHILQGDALEVRSQTQDWLRTSPVFAEVQPPFSGDRRIWAVAASIVELLADRSGQEAPVWTADVGPLADPFYVVAAAHRSARLRVRVESESPAPLRKRNIFAPPGYLEFV